MCFFFTVYQPFVEFLGLKHILHSKITLFDSI